MWVQPDCPNEHLDGEFHRLRAEFVVVFPSTPVALVRAEIGGRLILTGGSIVPGKCRFERMHHTLRDSLLNPENVEASTIVSMRPELEAAVRVDELHCDSQPIAGLPHAAL